jgi:hypothetical protein
MNENDLSDEAAGEMCRKANRWAAFTNKELEIFDYYLDIEVEHSPSETRLSMVKELQAELSRRKEAP